MDMGIFDVTRVTGPDIMAPHFRERVQTLGEGPGVKQWFLAPFHSTQEPRELHLFRFGQHNN